MSDHHAIIPTGEAKGFSSWSKQENQIYDLICRRFIAMFFPDRHVLQQQIHIQIGERKFVSFGEKVVDPGWSVVDMSKNTLSKELPEVSESEKIIVKNLRLRNDKTKPPAPHTEASLLTAMEHAGKLSSEEDMDLSENEYGIGTPATRAAIIEKMIEKEMAVRKGRTLLPTEYGIKLINILPDFLQSPEMTGEWEAKLSRISVGKEDPTLFMEGIHNLTREVIAFAINQGDTNIKESKSVGKCPLCGNQVREYESAYYCVNKECKFRKIYKAKKGYHPTLQSITMRELLANGSAVTEKGTYSIEKEPPYLVFNYAPKAIPNYKALDELINEYGLSPINKVPAGGGFWILGDKHDETVKDFVREAKEFGCTFDFYMDSKALKHNSGWCHRVESDYFEEFNRMLNSDTNMIGSELITDNMKKSIKDCQASENEGENNMNEDMIMKAIKESGFEYIDKRSSGGSLWIVAGETEGKPLIDECKKMGLNFQFTAKGGRASKHRPAWYSK